MSECKLEYLSGPDGWYLKKVNPIFAATVKVDKNPLADGVDEELIFHAKKIPGSMFRSWQAFCREVAARNKGHSEAALMLMYHPTKKSWQAFPPKQDLSSVFVDFSGVSDALEEFRKEHGAEWLLAGTLHSHPGDAHPSSTDVGDEEKMDGVHIVIPDFGRGGEKGIHAHICASGSRFRVKEAPGFLIDFSVKGEDPVPEHWYSQCKWDTGVGRRTYSGGRVHGGGWHGGGSRDGTYSDYRTGNEFIHKGEGPRTFKITVDSRDMNVLSDQFEGIESKVMLKKLGFSKAQRKYLCANFEGEMTEMLSVFEHCREALKYMKEIRGDVSKFERETMIDKAGDAVEVSMEMIKSICETILTSSDQSGFTPSKGGAEDDKDDDKEDEKEGGSEGGSRVAEPGSDLRDLPVI